MASQVLSILMIVLPVLAVAIALWRIPWRLISRQAKLRKKLGEEVVRRERLEDESVELHRQLKGAAARISELEVQAVVAMRDLRAAREVHRSHRSANGWGWEMTFSFDGLRGQISPGHLSRAALAEEVADQVRRLVMSGAFLWTERVAHHRRLVDEVGPTHYLRIGDLELAVGDRGAIRGARLDPYPMIRRLRQASPRALENRAAGVLFASQGHPRTDLPQFVAQLCHAAADSVEAGSPLCAVEVGKHSDLPEVEVEKWK